MGQLRRMLLVVCSVDLGTHFVDIHSPMQLLISRIYAHIHASYSYISYCHLFMFIISGSSFLVGEVIRLVVEDEVKRLFAFMQPVSNLMII